METQKRIKRGVERYSSPSIPRGSRSYRRCGRGRTQKNNVFEDQGSCIELLATVAGELLQKDKFEESNSKVNLILDEEKTKSFQGEFDDSKEGEDQVFTDFYYGNHKHATVYKNTDNDLSNKSGASETLVYNDSNEKKTCRMVIEDQNLDEGITENDEPETIYRLDNSSFLTDSMSSVKQTHERKENPKGLFHVHGKNPTGLLPQGIRGVSAFAGRASDSHHEDAGGSMLYDYDPYQSAENPLGSVQRFSNASMLESLARDQINNIMSRRKENVSANIDNAAFPIHSLVSVSNNLGIQEAKGSDSCQAAVVSNCSNRKSLSSEKALLNQHFACSSSNYSAPLRACSLPCDSVIDGHKDRLVVIKDDDENSSDITDLKSATQKSSKSLSSKGGKRGRSGNTKTCRSKVDTKESHHDMDIVEGPGITAQQNPISGFWKRRKVYSPSPLQSNIMGASSTIPGINKAVNGCLGGLSGNSGHEDSYAKTNAKICINSLVIPELTIDVSPTATVAEIQKVVRDSVLSLLENRLQIQVLLNGWSVKDDKTILRELGITCAGLQEDISFMLEPAFFLRENNASCSVTSNPTEVTKDLKEGYSDETNDTSCTDIVSLSGDHSESAERIPNYESPVLNPDPQPQPQPNDSIVCLHNNGTENNDGSVIIPARYRSKREDSGKRRLRRPFTITEVESLVEAVEKLGTGRWREIKIHAFDNAKHRTYVDLKDKWKTLVHTATIAPHQRRGEPVPLELLDRVIRAHTYWTERQKIEYSM